MKIQVSKEDIEGGLRRDASNCAVARALRRAGVNHAGVAGTLVLLANGGHHQYVVLPPRVQQWIASFDRGGETEPFEFELMLPEWAMLSAQPEVVGRASGGADRTRPGQDVRAPRQTCLVLEA